MPIGVVISIGVTLIAAIIGLDIWFAVDSHKDNTWSEILRDWGSHTPVVPWICGVLSGHFFHPIDNLKPLISFPGNIALLVWLTCVLAIIGVALLKFGYPIPPWAAFLPALVAGSLLWPV